VPYHTDKVGNGGIGGTLGIPQKENGLLQSHQQKRDDK
jgi:hypothetical protein